MRFRQTSRPSRSVLSWLTHWIADLSLHYKITIGNCCAIAIAIGLILIGYETGDYYQAQALQREMQVQQHRQALNKFQVSLLLTRTHWQEMSQFAKDPDRLNEAYRDLQQHAQQFQQDWVSLQALSGQPAKQLNDIAFVQQTQSLLAKYAEVPDAYFREVDMSRAASDQPGQPPSPKIILALLKQVNEAPQFQLILQRLDSLSESLLPLNQQAQVDIDRIAQAIEDTNQLRVWSSISGIVLAIVIATYLSWCTARSISRPIKQVITIAQLATEEARFDVQINSRRHDEVGQLAQAFNHLIQRVQELLWEQLAAQGELAQYNQQLEVMVSDRTQALETKNTELNTTLSELKTTQLQLVQTAKMSSLGQLVAGIAHEFNNPLTFVASNLPHAQTGFQDLLQALKIYQSASPQLQPEIATQLAELDLDYLLEDVPAMLVSMNQGTQRLQSIVKNLRHFSHLDEAESKTIQLHDGIDSTLLLLQTRLRSTIPNLPITIHKQYGKLPPLECYASQINQVFMDLLNNAIDAIVSYAPAAPADWQPEIHICTTVIEQPHQRSLQIRIADNGSGIMPEDLPQIFDPFFTTKPVGDGMGLGLALAYQVITAHGGQLTCQSQPQKGAEFTIGLPVKLDS